MKSGTAFASGWSTSWPALRVAIFVSAGNGGTAAKSAFSSGAFFAAASSAASAGFFARQSSNVFVQASCATSSVFACSRKKARTSSET